MFSCSLFSVITHITVSKHKSNSKANGFGRKTTLNFGEDLFFFFFFWRPPDFGEKIVRISYSGPKFTLNFGEGIRIFEGLGLPQSKILATPMVGPISASLRPTNTAPFEGMSQRRRAVGNTNTTILT